MSDTPLPSYVFKQSSFTVGNATIETSDTGTEGQVTLTEQVLFTDDVPDGMKVGGTAVYIQSFDFTFSGGSHNQVSRIKLWPLTVLGGSNTLSLSMSLILNGSNDTPIGSDSTVSVLTVIQLIPEDDTTTDWTDATSASGFILDSFDEDASETQTFAAQTVGAVSGTAICVPAVCGWDSTSDNDNNNKFTSIDLVAGTASYDSSADEPLSITGAYTKFNKSGGHDFTTSGLVYAIAASDPSSVSSPVPIAAQTSTYRADGGTDTLDFGFNVKNAYAVVKSITNSGDNGARNSLSAFTCSGVSVSVPKGAPTQVAVDWKLQRSDWKGAGAASWASVIDYMIIAELDVPNTPSS